MRIRLLVGAVVVSAFAIAVQAQEGGGIPPVPSDKTSRDATTHAWMARKTALTRGLQAIRSVHVPPYATTFPVYRVQIGVDSASSAEDDKRTFFTRPLYAPVSNDGATLHVILDKNLVRVLVDMVLPPSVLNAISDGLSAKKIVNENKPEIVFPYETDVITATVLYPEEFRGMKAVVLSSSTSSRTQFQFECGTPERAAAFHTAYANGNVTIEFDALVVGNVTEASETIQVFMRHLSQSMANLGLDPRTAQDVILSVEGDERVARTIAEVITVERVRFGHPPIRDDIASVIVRAMDDLLAPVTPINLDESGYQFPFWDEKGNFRGTMTSETRTSVEQAMERRADNFLEQLDALKQEGTSIDKSTVDRLFKDSVLRESSEQGKDAVSGGASFLGISASGGVEHAWNNKNLLKEETYKKLTDSSYNLQQNAEDVKTELRKDVHDFVKEHVRKDAVWVGEKWEPASIRAHRVRSGDLSIERELTSFDAMVTYGVRHFIDPIEMVIGEASIVSGADVLHRLSMLENGNSDIVASRAWVQAYVRDQRFATETFVGEQIIGVNGSISSTDDATRAWVNQQGFATQAWVGQRVASTETWANDHIVNIYSKFGLQIDVKEFTVTLPPLGTRDTIDVDTEIGSIGYRLVGVTIAGYMNDYITLEGVSFGHHLAVDITPTKVRLHIYNHAGVNGATATVKVYYTR